MSKVFYKKRNEHASIRDEFFNTLDGRLPETAKRQIGVLRKMRLDDDGFNIECLCIDKTTKEADKDTWCPLCFGEGQYWDESFIDMYKVVEKHATGQASTEQLLAPGLMNIPLTVIYTKSNLDIKPNDKIVEIELDVEGVPIKPYRRKAIYRISTPIDLRLDHGRLEYWKLATYKERVRFLNGPSEYS